ncbi:MAG: LysM peptidoglycan-binding domain-containing protein [Brevefilum sp.]
MQANFPDHQNKLQNNCPELGLRDDPVTFSAFPSLLNVCNHVKPATTPNITHQRTYCLNEGYINCPLLTTATGAKMPKEMALKTRRLSKGSRVLIIIAMTLVLLTATGVIIRYSNLWPAQSNQESTPLTTDLVFVPPISSPVVETVKAITNTPLEIELPPTETQAPSTPTREDPLLALGTPIGGEIQFIIHRVAEGETLQIFANQYNTSVEAITSVNHNLIVPLWTNWIVIIPFNFTDVSDLPLFAAHQVEEEFIPLPELAQHLSSSLTDMMFYNNLDAEHILHKGEWLIVPKE